ncbi:MAG: DUF4338 domain-containing protein, partial [Deltaproteobacteria bacterium]|nr:DUF4338 domain-containing protein [Deltaproteobacteria bacterium]
MLKKRKGSILQSGREISRQELDEIQETVGVFPRLSRTELAATICEHLGWMTASGGYKIDACMKLLEKLESKEFVELPEKQQKTKRQQSGKNIALTSKTEAQADIVGNLGDLGLVNVEVVKGKETTGLWNEYVSRYHYLGYKKPFGYVLRYFIVSEQGFLGCLMFAGASKAL